jgi:hypothetical protein
VYPPVDSRTNLRRAGSTSAEGLSRSTPSLLETMTSRERGSEERQKRQIRRDTSEKAGYYERNIYRRDE